MLARAGLHNGLSPKRLILRLTGAARTHYNPFLPASLVAMASASPLEASELLSCHTVFPYAVAFMETEEAERIARRLLSSSSPGPSAHKSLGALLRAMSSRAPCWRYCPECAAHDLQERGESYWRRLHCLPTMHWCPVHQLPLLVPRETARTLSAYLQLPLPHKQRGRSDNPSPPDWARYALTIATAATLDERWTARTDWAAAYRSVAVTEGFALTGSQVAGARLAAALRNAFGQAYLQRLGCDFRAPQHGWPALMVREGVIEPFAAVKHILLSVFLQGAGGREEAEGSSAFKYQPPGPKATNFAALDLRLSKVVQARTQALLRAGKRASVKGLLQSIRARGAFRHHREHLPLTTALLDEFKRTDASERKTGGREAHKRRVVAVALRRQKPAKYRARKTRDG